jgi:hypothetical protein
MRISERQLMCAIKNVNRIRLIRLFKNLLSFKNLFSFLIFNPATPISSFPIMLAARFPLSIPFKRYIQLLRRGRRLIRKKENITEIIHRSAYLCMNIHRYI